MQRIRPQGLMLMMLVLAPTMAIGEEKDDGFKSIFDGKTLKNWDGKSGFWSVKDEAITGQTTKENPTPGNTFIIWRGGETEDFELKLQYRIFGGNSGIQYRSFEVPKQKYVVGGYQADMEAGNTWSGALYGEKFRGTLAARGQKTVINADHKPEVVGKVGDSKEIQSKIKKEDWNEFHVIARGNHFVHKINGVVTIECHDNDTKMRRSKGILALQLHAGNPMKVQFRNIRLKVLKKQHAKAESPATKNVKKQKIVFVAGVRSHGFGSHEHKAGCMLLAKALNKNVPEADSHVVTGGWPKDTSIFDGAATIIIYSDGGKGHPFNAHLDELDKLMKKGVGMVCIHYGVEVPKGNSGNAFLDWTGGYFEANWSVNPHWTAKYKKFPNHPITRGVQPFEINDEWYYHMRFREKMEGVTPILSDLPTKKSLERGDGTHSGNPYVRTAVLERKEKQHTAWARQRPDGGRGFGFTGGHYHWNWGNDEFRKLVLNAICWTAHIEVPRTGVPSKAVTIDDLLENQDYPLPKNFNRARYQQMLNQWSGKRDSDIEPPGSPTSTEQKSVKPKSTQQKPVKPKFKSKTVTTRTSNHSVDIDVDIAGAKQLFLVVTDGGNGYGCDWADWAEPRLISAKGETKLTDLKWKSVSTSWGKVRIGKNASGGPLRIAGEAVPFGIGTHATSVIAFDLPAAHKFTRFKARGGLDNGGTDQQGGNATSVQFAVYTENPGRLVATVAQASSRGADVGSRESADALKGLDVADGLKATLFASEPQVLSLTNLDVDHRGRIWVCEVVNYRHNNGKRPEGDRILILEDTNGDGRCDDIKVFHQGRDVDTAMGICVLGNKIIVSATPNIIVFTDVNNDDKFDPKVDKKEYLFTKSGQVQHDHSLHSFLFGPDGKLYWNFGNTGKGVYDKDGKNVIDINGHPVIDNGKPLRGGMPFRCNLDGSQFEVLAHNFRNNYEVTVDSFGALWQSDNDDDGNRGVRINFVMEYGNYGYRDEVTGAGWKSPRTGMEKEVPLQHWHLNDPGVVPNLLQTGAGSPTGITIYEGRLLPKVFWDQVIHCDAGPNVVRAYPVTNDGAGYKAKVVNILHGSRDKWFRPADVCVAPDGSLFVTDWYDPGVGGHRQGDVTRGRLFRIAPPGNKYQVPKFDFETPEGATEALTNPSFSVRYLAWTALHKMGDRAESSLVKLFSKSNNPRHRARALWLLSKNGIKGPQFVFQAAEDKDANIRMTALRAGRQLARNLPKAEVTVNVGGKQIVVSSSTIVPALVEMLVHDRSPQVRRECAVALRNVDPSQAAPLWATLAEQYNGSDRWYLEALGIAADNRWDVMLPVWLEAVGGKYHTSKSRDIAWRSRGQRSPEMLTRIIRDSSTTLEDLPRFLRAFDFLSGPEKEAALIQLAFATNSDNARRQSFIVAEALNRLPNLDINGNPKYKTALNKVLDASRGSQQFVQLVSKFSLRERYPELLTIAQEHPAEQIGVEAIRALLSKNARPLIIAALSSKDAKISTATAAALGNSADGRSSKLLMAIVSDSNRTIELRRQAVRGVAKTKNGASSLLAMARTKRLDQNLIDAAAASLHTAQWRDIKEQAIKLFPLPPAKDSKPLPPVAQLLKRRGSVALGKIVFAKTGTCAKCHKVGGEGKEVGPNLTEIGDKLSRQAFFESVLYPNAGISHNYETYAVQLEDGNTVTGVKTSETPDSITIKSADAIERTIKKVQIEEIVKQKVSLMPADLQKLMTAEDLVNVVEYLTTLKKRK